MIQYTVIDGRNHQFDDLREAVSTLVYHYWRLLRTIYRDILRRTR